MHVLLQDGAGFHLRDGDDRLPDNVRIVTLPAYSPELNPVEGLWDQFKDALCNRVFGTVADLEAVLVEQLRGLLAGRAASAIPDFRLAAGQRKRFLHHHYTGVLR